MKPAVSVTVASYNYGRFLAAAIESVLAQTFGDLEMVVVDDGSTDDTPEVVLPFLSDKRVRYYRTPHHGVAAAKNLSIRFARAPLVAFLDADDLWLPGKLERQMALHRAEPGVGVIYARRLLIDEHGRRLAYQQPPLYRGNVLNKILHTNFVCNSSALVRRSVFDRVGIHNEDLELAVDYDLWLRVARAYRFDYVDEPLVLYRTGHANLSSRWEQRLLTVDRIMKGFLGERGGQHLVPGSVVRRARAELYFHIGVARRRRTRLFALPYYVRSLALCPFNFEVWRSLASLPLPERVRRWLRRAVGKPLDWSVPRLAEEADAPALPLASRPTVALPRPASSKLQRSIAP
jgi:glycosyltransferase involved in cell wall biosynthesis